jgi:hypothetical protein
MERVHPIIGQDRPGCVLKKGGKDGMNRLFVRIQWVGSKVNVNSGGNCYGLDKN